MSKQTTTIILVAIGLVAMYFAFFNKESAEKGESGYEPPRELKSTTRPKDIYK